MTTAQQSVSSNVFCNPTLRSYSVTYGYIHNNCNKTSLLVYYIHSISKILIGFLWKTMLLTCLYVPCCFEIRVWILVNGLWKAHCALVGASALNRIIIVKKSAFCVLLLYMYVWKKLALIMTTLGDTVFILRWT